MKKMNSRSIFTLLFFAASCFVFARCTEQPPSVDLRVKDKDKKVDVLVDGQLFTSYIYPETLKKPVLWPVISPQGNAVTRTFPMGRRSFRCRDQWPCR